MSSDPDKTDAVDPFDIEPAPPRESQIDRKQTGCCEEAQADGVCCAHPRNTCETCGNSVVDFSRHACRTDKTDKKA